MLYVLHPVEGGGAEAGDDKQRGVVGSLKGLKFVIGNCALPYIFPDEVEVDSSSMLLNHIIALHQGGKCDEAIVIQRLDKHFHCYAILMLGVFGDVLGKASSGIGDNDSV